MSKEVRIMPARFQLAEHARNVYVITVEENQKKEDVMNPDYWAHIAGKLRQYDEIMVRSDVGAFYGHLLVVACERTWAKTAVLSWVVLEEGNVSEQEPTDYRVEYKGPYKKFCVIRVEDSALLKDEIQTKKEANQWVEDYRITVGKKAA